MKFKVQWITPLRVRGYIYLSELSGDDGPAVVV